MKSAMVSRQGSMSRLQGPRSLQPIGDGSPKRRAAKSVKFDKTDEIIQYIAATPEISEDNWDQMSLESCDSDLDHRPLPALPDFHPAKGTREERLMQIPRFKAKLGAPMGDNDDEFDFGPASPKKDTEISEEELNRDPKTLLPSPFLHERSPIIDRPSMDVRMDAIFDGGSGMSPSLAGSSWHRRTSSQMSDFSDGGNESYFPVKKIPQRNPEQDDPEPAEWRDKNDPSLARQDSLQEDQRHLPTFKLSEKPLPGPADLDRTYSRRKQKLLQMLDPHGAGVSQSAGINTIMEEAEETSEEEAEESKEPVPRSAPKTYRSPLDISLGDDSYWHPESDASNSNATMTADSTMNMTANMTANQSIGISNEPAARYAAGLSKGLESDLSKSILPESPTKETATEELPQISPVDSVFDRSIHPEPSSDSDISADIEYIHPSEIHASYDMSQLTTPSRVMPNMSYEASRLPYYNTTDLEDLEEPSKISIEDDNASENIALDAPESASEIVSESVPDKVLESALPVPKVPGELTAASSPIQSSSSIDNLSEIELDLPDVQELPPMSPPRSEKEHMTPRIDTSSPKSLSSLLSEDKKPRHNAYPGVLPWDPSLDTTVDDLAAMPTPVIPPRSPERKRRSLMLDRPLQSKASDGNLSVAQQPPSPSRASPSPERDPGVQSFRIPLNQWEPENEENSAEEDVDSESWESSQSEPGAIEPESNEQELVEQNSGLKPIEKSSEKPVELSVETPAGKSLDTPLEKPTERPEEGSLAKEATTVSAQESSQDVTTAENSVIIKIPETTDASNSAQTDPSIQKEQADSLYVAAKDFDPNVLEFMASNSDENIAAPTGPVTGTENMPTAWQQRPLPGRKDSTASLRNKQSFVPLTLPSLSPIDLSTSPFMSIQDNLKEPQPPQHRRIIEVASQASANQPHAFSSHVKNSSISPSVATDNGESLILKDMSFETEELSHLQRPDLIEKHQQEVEENDEESIFASTAAIKSQPLLDSDLSDFESQQNSPRELPVVENSEVVLSPIKSVEPNPAEREHEANLEALEANYSLRDGDVSIRRPSFGENMASTMMSLFSDQFEDDNAANTESVLDRVTSRHTYNLRESGSYVIATSPRRSRQKLSSAYEVLSSDETEYPVPQNAIQRSQALPSASSLGAYSTGQPPSDISKSGSSVYSMTRGSSSGSVPLMGPTTQQKTDKAPLSVIEEPEEEEASIAVDSPAKVPQVQTSVNTVAALNENNASLPRHHVEESDTTKRSSNYDIISESPEKQGGRHSEMAQPFATGFDRNFNASQASLPRHAGEILLPTPAVAPWVSNNNLAAAVGPQTIRNSSASKESPPIEDGNVPNGLLYLILSNISTTDIPSEALVTLQIDNGIHCIASKAMPVSKLGQFSKEYRIGFMENMPVSITLKLSLEQAIEHKFKGLGSDGSFAKFDLYPLRKYAFGKPLENDILRGMNAWGSSRKAVAATVKITALYIPRVSQREDAPQTLKGAMTRLTRSREELRNVPPLAQGALRQYGGDLKNRSGKQRYLILDPVSPLLVTHSIRTRRPRTLINLAKATEVAATGNESFEIRFRNHDTLMFYASNSTELNRWVSSLKSVIGKSEGARPKWIDAILYDSQ